MYRKESDPGQRIFPCAWHKDLLSGSWRRAVTGLRSACRVQAGYGGDGSRPFQASLSGTFGLRCGFFLKSVPTVGFSS